MSGPNGKDSLPDMQVSGPGGEPGAPGMVEMVIAAHEKRVVQLFRRPMLEVIYEPVNAALVGRELINRAVECGAMEPMSSHHGCAATHSMMS